MADDPYANRNYSPYDPAMPWGTAGATPPYFLAELKRLRACVCGTPAAVIPTAATPVFAPIAGSYELPFSISITSETETADIHYTLDGSDPDVTDPIFDPEAPIMITQDSTICAIAIAPGYNNSEIACSAYTIEFPQAAAPLFDPAPGDYPTTVVVTITSPNGGTMYYTTNGSAPTSGSTEYSGPITVLDDTTIRVFAVVAGFTDSEISNGVYTVTPLVVATPTYSPSSGSFSTTVNVTIATTTPLATIYYTTDNTEPDETDFLYSGPITLSATTTLRAKAFRTGYTASGTAIKTYTLTVVTSVWTFYGRSFNPQIVDGDPQSSYMPFVELTQSEYDNDTNDYSYDANGFGGDGPYAYYGVPEDQDPAAATPDGFATSFALAPASFAQADEGYTLTDANGWPYYLLALTAPNLPPTIPAGNWRVYRLKNQLNGAFTLHVTQ